MSTPYTLWIDGSVKIDGDDLLTIDSDVDGPVKIDINSNQISHAGSAAVDSHTDETKTDVMLTLSGTVFNQRILEKLVGMTKTTGVSEDGTTPADLLSFAGNVSGYGRRPYVEILATGYKAGTLNVTTGEPYKVEVWGLRAKLMGTFSVSMDKDNHSKVELAFKLHRDPDDRTATWFQVRDEQLES